MPKLPTSLSDAKNQVSRAHRTVEGQTRAIIGGAVDAVSRRIPEGVKEAWREARGYRLSPKQRHGDIALPREGTSRSRGRQSTRR